MRLLMLLAAIWFHTAMAADYRLVSDPQRQREIPIQLSFPSDAAACTDLRPCPVALLNSGYGVAYDHYAFISDALNTAGYLVVAIQHELQGDPALAVTGDLFSGRRENWQRGAASIRQVHQQLQSELVGYNFDEITLVGHSNGGDISSWLILEGTSFVRTLITLDHRRVPLPRMPSVSVLSLRASDFPADDGVLYSAEELMALDACLVHLADAKHNEMTDFGPDWLKHSLASIMLEFVAGHCRDS